MSTNARVCVSQSQSKSKHGYPNGISNTLPHLINISWLMTNLWMSYWILRKETLSNNDKDNACNETNLNDHYFFMWVNKKTLVRDLLTAF